MAFAYSPVPILGANQEIGVVYNDSGTVTMSFTVAATTDTKVAGVLPTETSEMIGVSLESSGVGWAFREPEEVLV